MMKTDFDILHRVNSINDLLGYETSVLYRRLPAELRKTVQSFEFDPEQEQLPRDVDSLVIELKDWAYEVGKIYTTDYGGIMEELQIISLLKALVWLSDDGFYDQMMEKKDNQTMFLEAFKHYGLIK